jgi:hypothetical protein
LQIPKNRELECSAPGHKLAEWSGIRAHTGNQEVGDQSRPCRALLEAGEKLVFVAVEVGGFVSLAGRWAMARWHVDATWYFRGSWRRSS